MRVNRWAVEAKLSDPTKTLERPDQLRRDGMLPCDLRSDRRHVEDLNDLVDDGDPLAAAAGVLAGLVVSLIFWGLILALAYVA